MPKAVPKVGPQLAATAVEPRGSEFLEEGGEGSALATNPDMPPEAFHAGMTRETDLEFRLGERGMGPTEPLGPWDEEEAAQNEPAPDEESPAEDEGGKEASSEAKAPRSEHIPRERFDEVNEKMKRFEKDAQMLSWILENPTQFAKTVKGQQEEASPPEADEFKVVEPQPGKDLSEMSDKEVFDYAVRKEVSRVINDQLGGVLKDLHGLKNFRGSMEDLLLKAATGPDGKPLFPRWEELRPAVGQVLQKHPTLDRREAYVLADRLAPAGAGYSPPAERPASEPPGDLHKNVPEQGPADKPKRGSVEAIRAARLMDLGRASGAYSSNTRPRSPKEAIEYAMREHGFPED